MALLASTWIARRSALLCAPAALALLLAACGGDEPGGSGGGTSTTTTTTGPGSGGGGQGGSGGGGSGGSGGSGGQGGGTAELTLDAILDALRADRDAALRTYSEQAGFPIKLPEGYLFVCDATCEDLGLNLVAGDFDGWAGTPLTAEPGEDFRWALLATPQPGDKYKFTDLGTYVADPWARSYTVDGFGEISHVEPTVAHVDRYRDVAGAGVLPRNVRVWVPAEPIERVLYAHDGQNLFYNGGPFGSWSLEQTAPPGMLIVGMDSTAARMDEYTHVQDDIGSGGLIGGHGDAYADFIEDTVRPMIQARYGEPGLLGVMGSSLGGLISLHVADRNPGTYAFAASLSGTMGWGSIGAGVTNETMIERYAAHAQPVVTTLYIDSGGVVEACVDSDGDGTDDDNPGDNDNYCENLQMRDTLINSSPQAYTLGGNLFYVHAQGAQHNEAAWAARVEYPLEIFASLSPSAN